MGIDGLTPLIAPGGNKKTHSALSDAQGAIVAVDISSWMHSAINNINVAREFSREPLGSMENHVIDFFTMAKQFTDQCGWTLVFVFDQARNPRKADTDASRAAKVSAAMAELNRIFQSNRKEEFSLAEKTMTQAVYVSDDVYAATLKLASDNNIRCVSGPYEADHQLVY